jgi:hypothetical protein
MVCVPGLIPVKEKPPPECVVSTRCASISRTVAPASGRLSSDDTTVPSTVAVCAIAATGAAAIRIARKMGVIVLECGECMTPTRASGAGEWRTAAPRPCAMQCAGSAPT